MFRMYFGLAAAVIVLTALAGNNAVAQTQTQYFVFPVPGHGPSNVTQAMTKNTYPPVPNYWHTGIDIVSPNSTAPNVVASAYGRISKIQPNVRTAEHGEGNSVMILHFVSNGLGGYFEVYTQYSHLASFAKGLYVGKSVQAGTVIGVMGRTAYASDTGTSRHLHFEVKYGSELQNPWYPANDWTRYWGYTPLHPAYYGWINPSAVLYQWTAGKI